ncbi:hypothetical protein F5J12DRAFT_888248 [Pisolithus orientalis]|uniref:uncharacterized protein n=1 Tax=Pisolithus orientalis TaxID=936130 RepID=UPI0022255C2B|nr:uncharacterized protein F5J12DRAFT_888248 [Pisolithus orientalis]KAI6030452.1 hypothetical protein F5J12DRAFT_888248 [Pisolithus orientalis]
MSLGWISRVSALFAVTCLPSVLAIQPSADYGQYKTPNLYNCSGANPTSALTATNSADTLPQIQPLSSQGWEQWEFFLHGTFPIILRWSQGDQSQADATPANGKIEIAILDVNGTNVETSVTGPLTYTSGDVNQITIGNNTFKWDSDSLWYNVTLSAEGYTLVLNTYSAILDTFHPNVEQYNGLLSSHGPALYGSVPVTRGQSVGYLTTPDKQNITVSGLVLLKHSFSQQALPSYYYDSNFFYQVEQVDGTVHEATYLSRAIAGSVVKSEFPSTWGLYAVTDDPSAYTLVVDPIGATIVSTLPGCSLSNNASYLFSVAVGNVITEFMDLGGGKTTYYNVSQGFTLASYDGGLVNGTIAGMYQVYEAPLLNDS